MTINTNSDMRFMGNNYLKTGYNTFEITSIADNFIASNMLSDQRSQTTRFGGRFLIGPTNKKIHVDGVAYSVAEADYQSPALLAAAMTTALAALSIDVTYDDEALTFNFSRAIAFTMNYSTLTDAIWETIGIYSVVDTAATLDGSYQIDTDVARIHWPYEEIEIDFGYQASIGFIGIIGDLSTDLKIPESAIVTVYANNIYDFTAPPLEQVLVWRNKGMFHFVDDIADSAFRYVKIRIECPDGPIQPEIGHLYIGDSTEFSSRNISNGFEIVYEDRSILSQSENGQIYSNKKVPLRAFNGMKVGLVSPANVAYLKNLFYLKQVTTPFFVCVDPQALISNDTDDMMMFCRFNGEPRIRHIQFNIYELEFQLREAM